MKLKCRTVRCYTRIDIKMLEMFQRRELANYSRDNMGFFHQLCLLLWKNFTLKKRSPFVFLFEMFIPLVLFLILLFIRKKEQPYPQNKYVWNPQALPSAGAIPILQKFCETNNQHYNDSLPHDQQSVESSARFLRHLQDVGQKNHFFSPGYTPVEMEQLPGIYQNILSGPVYLQQSFLQAQNFQLHSIFSNSTRLTKFLVDTGPLTKEDVDDFLNATVNIKEVYRLLFGSFPSAQIPVLRVRRSVDKALGGALDLDSVSNFANFSQMFTSDLVMAILTDIVPEFQNGVIHELMNDSALWDDKQLIGFLLHFIGHAGNYSFPSQLSANEIAEILKLMVFSPPVLRKAACDSDEFSRLLNSTFSSLTHIETVLCNMSDTQLEQLAGIMKEDISEQAIISELNLHAFNTSKAVDQVEVFMVNVEKFYQFQMTLYDLSVLVEPLPQNGCDLYSQTNTTTPTPDHVKPTEMPTDEEKRRHKNKFAGLLKFWDGMQKMICGHDPPDRHKTEVKVTPGSGSENKSNHRNKRSADDLKDIDDFNIDDLGLNDGQESNLRILLHVMYSNPKVLYAPNNTAANTIIKKANETFQLLDTVNVYAREWLNISADLRAYLLQNSTARNLVKIKQIQEDLRDRHAFISILTLDSRVKQFINLTIPDISFFIHQIDTIDNAACTWLTLLSGINMNTYIGFQTEWELVDFFLTKQYHENVSVVAAVVFENLEANATTLPPHVRYKIRQNATFTPTTKRVRNKYWTPGPGSGDYPYYSFGFLWIQDIIERAIINVQVGRDVVEPGSYMVRFPFPCWLYDLFVHLIEHVMPLCLTISWVYSVAMLVQSIVYEKEHRLKEVMKMMGLSNAVHWLAWFITTFVQFSVTMAVLTTLLKFGKVLVYSNALVIFATLEVFAIATISFCFLISTLYSKAKVAAACAGIIYFLTYVPYMYVAIKEDVAGDSISSLAKTLVSLSSTTAFGLGGKYFAFYEESGVGVQWNNINVSPVENDQFNLLMVIMMMIFDSILYGLVALYIENVFPGQYGLPKPWYFPFTRSYWCGGPTRTHEPDCSSVLDLCRHKGYSIMEEDQAVAIARDPDHASKFEAEPTHLQQGVCIDNLTKVYKTGKKLAVRNLSLNLYEDQITSFLGHNGAGKTTTMSILSGLFPPTSGSATIYGHDIRTDMEVIRQGLGMCPQHNVLFDKLTVEEHLWFYARLKGMKTSDINAEMDTMFEDLGLPKKRKSMVDCLSGGMQRKLSVAIAFVGGSQTVILDEPTAGIDPYARRAIWDLLIKYKNGRTILLSTHHMDEADLLGDRIAIVSNGELKCCGSSLFLKNTFCEGYHLYLVKKEIEDDIPSTDDLDTDITERHEVASKCDTTKVTDFIHRYVSTAYLKKESRLELHYILPYEEAKKGNFEKLFQALETAQSELFISSYGVADSTLEEVFLEVTQNSLKHGNEPPESKELQPCKMDTDNSQPSTTGDGSPPNDDAAEAAGNQAQGGSLPGHAGADVLELGHITETSPESGHSQQPGTIDAQDIAERFEHGKYTDQRNMDMLAGRGSHILPRNLLLLNHFRAVIIKRFHYITRNWKGLFSQILLPALFVSIAMTVALSAPKDEDLPPLELSPAQYFNLTQPKGNFIPFSNEHQSPRAEKYLYDAGPQDLIKTFHLPSGVSATCVLKSPFNSSFDEDIFKNLNLSDHTLQLLSKYFEDGCGRVFVPGIQLDNYVPEAAIISNKGILEQVSPLVRPTDSIPSKRYYPHCECNSDHSGFECSDSGFESPPQFRVVTRDIMQDISTKDIKKGMADMGAFYMYTTDEYRLHRYGAFSFGTERDFVPEDFGKDGPTALRSLAVRGTAWAWFNNKGYHAMPVYLNALNNAILRANLPTVKGHASAYGITVINHPMNQTNNQLNMDYILQGADVLIAIFIIVAMSFVPASFVVFLVYERSIKAKHLQFVSGLNPVIYWIANYFWDICNYVIPAICIIVILLAFQIPAYVSSTNLPAVIALFFLYGWSMTPLMYPASFFFKEPSTAYIFLIVINLFTGITCIVSSFLLEIFSYDKDLEKIHTLLKEIFLVFPNYCLGRGLMDIAFNQYKNEFFFKTGQYDKMQSPLRWDLITRKLVLMSITGLVFFIVTLLCEYRFFIKSSCKKIRRRHSKYVQNTVVDEDVDVAAERKRVLRGSGKKDLLRLENLTKVYKTRKLGHHLAVDKMCVGVPKGECFGLLGVNGAGKTTTFKMLTGDIIPTAGDAFLNNYSIQKDALKVQQNIGYCPQFDALFDELTAKEHLLLYCRLRGVPPAEEKQIVEWALTKLALKQYENKTSNTYSGGNKRKLSTAIALIGHPPLIFMDEPTTGMDPHSRRFLWDLIHSLTKDGRSVILTSHSMEECEALCTRLAIMVNGKFKCLGSIQHLKNKFGDGYTISLRLKGPDYERAQRQAQRFVSQKFPEAVIKECHYNLLQFEMTCASMSLSYAFSHLEDATRDLDIEDYSINQNNLDNVFINFVKQQVEIVQESEGSCQNVTTENVPPLRRVSSATPSVADDIDVDLLHDLTVTADTYPMDDDDEPLLNFDETGTHLTLMTMDNLNV